MRKAGKRVLAEPVGEDGLTTHNLDMDWLDSPPTGGVDMGHERHAPVPSHRLQLDGSMIARQPCLGRDAPGPRGPIRETKSSGDDGRRRTR